MADDISSSWHPLSPTYVESRDDCPDWTLQSERESKRRLGHCTVEDVTPRTTFPPSAWDECSGGRLTQTSEDVLDHVEPNDTDDTDEVAAEHEAPQEVLEHAAAADAAEVDGKRQQSKPSTQASPGQSTWVDASEQLVIEATVAKVLVRPCVVCFGAQITTASMPCRHSTMCVDCMTEVRRRDKRCPVCRVPIDYCINGHFDTEFINLTPRLLAHVEQNLERAKSAAYNGMYQNIRTLLLAGALCFAGGLVCFAFQQIRSAVAMAIIGAIIGYIPWLFVTIAAFESEVENREAGRWQFGQQAAFSSNRRFSAICGLLCKSVLYLALGPIITVLFLVPLGIFKLLLRPLVNVLRCLAYFTAAFIENAVLYSYTYLFRPLCVFIIDVVYYAGCFLLMLVDLPIYIAGQTYRGTVNVCGASSRCATASIACFMAFVTSACLRVYSLAVAPSMLGVSACVDASSRCLCVPFCTMVSCVGMAGSGCARGLAVLATKAYENLVAPVTEAFSVCFSVLNTRLDRCLAAISGAVASCFAAVYGCLYTCGAAMCGGLHTCGDVVAGGIAAAAAALYAHVLAPIGRFVHKCVAGVCGRICRCGKRVASAIGGVVLRCGSVVYSRTAAACATFYTYSCAPAGRCVRSCGSYCAQFGSAVHRGVASLGAATHRGVLEPIGLVLWSSMRWVFLGITAAARTASTCLRAAALGVVSVFQDIRTFL